jgi:hypothetical protein
MANLLELQGGTVANYTPGTTNNVNAALPEFPTLRINEVLPSNVTGISDSFGEREPWIEILNTGDFPVSLDGLFLTDDPFALTQWAFPPGQSIPARGFLVVFADGEPNETGPNELHTNFRLPNVAGWSWFTALTRLQNGQPAVVDYLQGVVPADDTAVGRQPDGDPSSTVNLPVPTPGAQNAGAVNFIITSIVLNASKQPVITWQSVPGANYRVEYNSNLVATTWSNLATLMATGMTASHVDQTLGAATRRFYRVVKP